MKSQKAKIKEQKALSTSINDDLEAASPPAPSRNGDFRMVHDEIPMLQNVARVYLGVIMESIANGRPVSWPRFITDATPHRNITTNEEIEKFLKSKLMSSKKR